MQFQNVCDGMFVVFAIVFGVTRILIYPNWILASVLFKIKAISVNFFGLHYFYVGLLGTLQILHIFWFITIVRMVWSC